MASNDPLTLTDAQITEAARRQALLDVFGRGQGKPDEVEPDERTSRPRGRLSGHRGANGATR
jgi:hypothetical protein